MSIPGWIHIRGLRFDDARLGTTPPEMQRVQPVVVDVSARLDISAANEADVIESTLDYTTIAAHIGTLVGARHYRLVETLCLKIGQSLLAGFGELEEVRVEVHKPEAITGVGVSIATTFHRETSAEPSHG